MSIKKALIIGINKYGGDNDLNCCVNDVTSLEPLLKYNGNLSESKNFAVKKLLDEKATRNNIVTLLENVFDDDTDIGLFYFSGHGFDDEEDGKIVVFDDDGNHSYIGFNEILTIINHSRCKNKIVLLDSCFSGSMGQYKFIGDESVLGHGVTIITACREKETSIEIGENGLFTYLLIEGLKGGAADIMGRITPGSLYAYIDRSLGEFDQRPIFKSNVSSFICLRNVAAKISERELRKLPKIFKEKDSIYKLDSSYEPTNYVDSMEGPTQKPYRVESHVKIFAYLQKLTSNGLVKPVEEKHMYYAAMNGTGCELTELGKHYWLLAKKEII